MDVCYYAIRSIVIGDEVREPGDLIPEATTWKEMVQRSYVEAHRIAPVLVASLPKATRDFLNKWEKDWLRLQEVIEVEHPVSEIDEEDEESVDLVDRLLDEEADFDLDALEGGDI